MAAEETLRAVITVIDRTAAPLHAINARFAAMSAPLRQVAGRLGNLANEAGLTAVAHHARHAAGEIRALGGELLDIAKPLATLGALGSVAGLAEAALGAAEYGEKLRFAAIQTGMSAQAIAKWHYAAGLANIDTARLDRGFTYLNKQIGLAASGRAKEVQKDLAALGIGNTPENLAKTGEVLKAVTSRVSELIAAGRTPQATALLADFMGARSGAQMMPLLGKGAPWLDEAMKAAQAHGLVPTDAATKRAEQFEEAYKGVKASVEGLALSIGDKLFPALTGATGGLSAWIDKNREWISTNISDAVTNLSTSLKAVNWHAIVEGVKEFAGYAKWAWDKLGGMTHALELLAAIKLAPLANAMLGLGRAVAFLAVRFIPLLTALAANPIGIAVIAAVALAGIAYEIYEHWSGIKAFFSRLGHAIAGYFWDAVHGIAEAFKWVVGAIEAPFLKIQEAVNWVGDHMPSMPEPDKGNIRAHNIWEQHQKSLASQMGRAAKQSEAKVTLDFKNVPKGVAASVETKGNPDLDLNLGHAMAY